MKLRAHTDSKNKKGFSLIEVLMVLLIFSTVVMVAVSLMLKSARLSLDNEISDRATNVGKRVLEYSKKSDRYVLNCDTGQQFEMTTGMYSIGSTIDFSKPATESVCFKPKGAGNSSSIISECRSDYEVNILFPRNANNKTYVEYEESYCVQVIVEPINSSDYEKVTIVVVYSTLTEQNLRNIYYGFR